MHLIFIFSFSFSHFHFLIDLYLFIFVLFLLFIVHFICLLSLWLYSFYRHFKCIVLFWRFLYNIIYLDNNNSAPSLFRSLCENRRWLFWTEVFFWGSAAPEEKYRGPKQSPTNSHNDRNKDGAKLLLSLITATLTILTILTKTRREQHFLSFLYSSLAL